MEQHEQAQRHSYRLAVLVAMGSLAIASAPPLYDKLKQAVESGTDESYQPLQHCASPNQEPQIGTWNMAGQLPAHVGKVQQVVAKHRLDVLSMQEVAPTAVPVLRQKFPCYAVSYVLANGSLGGRKGNVIMTRGPVHNVISYKITDKSLSKMVVDGAWNVISNRTTNTSTLADNKIVEKRAALSVTTDLMIDGSSQQVQFVTGHIGRQAAVRTQQLDRLLGFVKTRGKTQPNTIFCGDVNTQPSTMLGIDGKFAGINFYASRTKATFARGSSTIDYCADNNQGPLELTHVQRDKSLATDHHPVIGTLAPRNPSELLFQPYQLISNTLTITKGSLENLTNQLR